MAHTKASSRIETVAIEKARRLVLEDTVLPCNIPFEASGSRGRKTKGEGRAQPYEAPAQNARQG